MRKLPTASNLRHSSGESAAPLPSGLLDGAPGSPGSAHGAGLRQGLVSARTDWGAGGREGAARRPQQHDSPRHLVAHLHRDACDAASNSPAEDTDAAKTGSRVVSKASRSPAAASSAWREDLNRSSHDAKLTRDDLVGGNSGSAHLEKDCGSQESACQVPSLLELLVRRVSIERMLSHVLRVRSP